MSLSTRTKIRLALQALANEYQSQLARQITAKTIAKVKDDVSESTWGAQFIPTRENLLSGASLILKAQEKVVTPMWIKVGMCLGLALIVANSPVAMQELQSAVKSFSQNALQSASPQIVGPQKNAGQSPPDKTREPNTAQGQSHKP